MSVDREAAGAFRAGAFREFRHGEQIFVTPPTILNSRKTVANISNRSSIFTSEKHLTH